MATPSKRTMREVSADEWADFVSNYRTYQTEETWRTGYSVMFSKLSVHQNGCNCGFVVAEAHYMPDGQKAYFVDTSF